ncbi:MAG: 1,4-dihydroxy-2-naphthoate polyprenyltransferase [Chloroflexi bacterium]|nr:1,4-dihydroxy-2-naphthoate polyprenyltransferase [Chloroflexota bacterium]
MAAARRPAEPGSLRAWVLAARPPTLTASVVPVIVGTATGVVHASFRPAVFVATLLASMCIQIGTNLANDYSDYVNGADTSARLGPPRAAQSGLLPPEAVRNAAAAVFGIAVICGAYLVTVGGWLILAIGLVCVISGVLYTGGPWPFGYHGLGDLFVFVCFGLLGTAGSAYLQAGTIGAQAIANAVPVGLLITAILVVNNLRDFHTDRTTGKRTLAVILGERATRLEYTALLVGTYLVPLGGWLSLRTSIWFWLPYLTLPLALQLGRVVWRAEGRALNPALAGTARLTLLYGVALMASVLLQR